MCAVHICAKFCTYTYRWREIDWVLLFRHCSHSNAYKIGNRQTFVRLIYIEQYPNIFLSIDKATTNECFSSDAQKNFIALKICHKQTKEGGGAQLRIYILFATEC